MFRSLGANIWDHEMRIRFGGIPLWHRMTVIRLTNGGLIVHSPTRLDLASQEEFQKLGPIVAIIAPSWWHDLYLREYLIAYPNARLYGAPTLVRWNRSLPFAELLDDLATSRRLGASLWTNEVDQVHVLGIGLFLDEIVFYHRRSRSLIVADLLFNLSEKDAWITRAMGSLVIGPFPVADLRAFIGLLLQIADACARRWSGYLIGTSIRSSLATAPSSQKTARKSSARLCDGS
jgi:Domain of unknown function (DUF4336)